MNRENTEAWTKAFVDTFIMAVSASTILDLKELKMEADHDEDFFEAFIKNTSLFAKACESQDHKEHFPYRKVWVSTVTTILTICIQQAVLNKVDIVAASKYRLTEVEKLILENKRKGSV